jgi:hypothetical protein
VARKAVAVIGMRRIGKTTLPCWQGAWRASPEGLLYFGLEDERLGGLAAADLQLIVEEYCGRAMEALVHPFLACPP